MTDRVYCILCDRPSTYLQVARRLSGGRKPTQETKERVSRHIRDLRYQGIIQCVGYRDNPGYVPGTETPRWLQVWEVRHRWPIASDSCAGHPSSAPHATTSPAREVSHSAARTASATIPGASDARSTVQERPRTIGFRSLRRSSRCRSGGGSDGHDG